MQKSTKEILKEASDKTEEHEFYNHIPEGYKRGKTKYIVVTGSVMSGVGKGTFTSCLGNMLKLQHGFNIVPLKFECYLNYDSGTLNPYRHGEVFVLDDGTECDLDLGTYERMLNLNLTRNSFVTVGRVFKSIIDKEREGKYLGRDVEVIPHVTGEIKGFLRDLAVKSKADIITIEIGGTVGEIQNSFYLEAMREFAYEEGKENVCFINVTYILQPGSLGEQKSKAAQIGIKTLMSVGIQPDIIVCRAESPIQKKIKEKISISSNVPVSRIIDVHDTKNIYKVPLHLKDIEVDKAVFEILNIKGNPKPTDELEGWKKLDKNFESSKKEITIGIAGKYTNVWDSYLSIIKAIEHTGPYLGTGVNIKWVESTKIDSKNIREVLKGIDGIIIPGGFGKRGIEGKIECIKYARENNIPFLGLCLGFQLAVIEFARNVCGLTDATTTEIDSNAKEPVICILPEQEEVKGLGGTMRLGGLDVVVKKDTLAHKLYGKDVVRERFRHRWNANTKYIDLLEKKGLVFSGRAPEKKIMQILEMPGHPFFLATQFHGEFTSRPLNPSPLFRGFVEAALMYKKNRE
ncbi:MAG: CTP synthase (glutamine hydrolyzing) [Candidatus Aenigmatarchaeota archaeon]|nr:CTP synthase (glutamine hydrolyzing) [Nanoarchaeota archaeon]